MLEDLALTVLRVVLGAIMFGHGAQKLFGWFQGGGIEGTSQFFGQLRVRQPRLAVTLVGVSEAGGGAALVLGLLTPLACAAIASSMLGAILLAHWPRFWVTDSGLEYPLVVLAAITQFGLAGPGGWSLDRALDTESILPNPWTFLLLAAFVVLGVAAVAMNRVPESGRQASESRRAA